MEPNKPGKIKVAYLSEGTIKRLKHRNIDASQHDKMMCRDMELDILEDFSFEGCMSMSELVSAIKEKLTTLSPDKNVVCEFVPPEMWWGSSWKMLTPPAIKFFPIRPETSEEAAIRLIEDCDRAKRRVRDAKRRAKKREVKSKK